MRRSKGATRGDGARAEEGYFTYRPLSNLPTPPPTSKDRGTSPAAALDGGEPLKPGFRGPAIHLVNLIPSVASLAAASVPLVQAMLSRAGLPIETVALAVGILDSLDTRFARRWRLTCPLRASVLSSPYTHRKHHSLPPTPPLDQPRSLPQVHIDSVSPELIILAALVIATKFTEDPQEPTQFYCAAWGDDLWSHEQLNATERCIMESLDYRIMPLCHEDCLADAMVDMQLADQQHGWRLGGPSPPGSTIIEEAYVPAHSRSKTMGPGMGPVGLGLPITPADTPAAVESP